MKSRALFFIFLCFRLNVIAGDTAIVFRKTSYSDWFEIAKKEQKPLLIYFHFQGCGSCTKMENNTLNKKEVINFYNANFICIDVDTKHGEGIELVEKLELPFQPSFLYYNVDGEITNKIVGGNTPEEFIQQGKNALALEKYLQHVKQQYKEGRKDADFLYDYCYRLRDIKELTIDVVNDYLNTQSVSDLKSEKNIKFIYEFAVLRQSGYPTISLNSAAANLIIDHSAVFYKYFDKEQVRTRILYIANAASSEAIDKQDKMLYDKANKVENKFSTGAPYYEFKNMDGEVIMAIIPSKHTSLRGGMAYYEKGNDTVNYQKALNKYLKAIWDDSDECNSFAWESYERYNDKKNLELAVRCVKRSIELSSNYANNDTYAWLLYKLEKYSDALLQAEKAIEIAKKENVEDYKSTLELVDKAKEKIKH